MPDYLTATLGGRRGRAGKLLRTAAHVGDRPKTWQALDDGALSPEHSDVIVRVIDHLPVDATLREAAEDLLIQEAAKLNATELEVAGNHLLEVLDPDGVAKREEKKLDKLERSAHLNRFLAIVDDGIGGVKIRGRGTVEDAAVIKAALQALSAPLPATDPDCGTEGRDERDHGARTWDALVEVAQTALDSETLPTAHGQKPRVTVTVSWEDLRAGVGTATLETGEKLSVAAVRRLACDAEILPIVLDGNGVPLDVGRANRLVTMGIWLALIARDKHCAFPGCTRPPIACDAHHVEHWIDGGKTSVKTHGAALQGAPHDHPQHAVGGADQSARPQAGVQAATGQAPPQTGLRGSTGLHRRMGPRARTPRLRESGGDHRKRTQSDPDPFGSPRGSRRSSPCLCAVAPARSACASSLVSPCQPALSAPGE